MILKEYDWDTHALVPVEVEDGPIEDFLNFLFTTRRWQEDPELVYKKYIKLKETLFGSEARRRRAIRAAEKPEVVEITVDPATLPPVPVAVKRGPGRPRKTTV